MTAHVLCPGPSLGRWPDSSLVDADEILGVNRAVHRVRCTRFVFKDIHPPIESPPVYSVGKVTIAATEAHCRRRRAVATDEAVLTFEQIEATYPVDRDNDWQKWTSIGAIVVAAYLGATDICVYGMDRAADAPDWDGVQLASNRRTADRFADEAKIFRHIAGWLSDRGIGVRRMIYGTR